MRISWSFSLLFLASLSLWQNTCGIRIIAWKNPLKNDQSWFLSAIAKLDSHYVGYDALTGRFSAYMLGYIFNFKKETEKAK